MKETLLLLIPLLLSQCANDDRSNNFRVSHQQNLNSINQVSKDVLKSMANVFSGDVSYRSKVELLSLLKQYRHNYFPLQPLSISEYQKNFERDVLMMGIIMAVNSKLLTVTTSEDYMALIVAIVSIVVRHKKGLLTEKNVNQLLSMFSKYKDGPFPLKSVSTKEIEDQMRENLIVLVSRQKFNDIISHNSKQKYDEELKKLESEVNKK